MTPVRAGVVLLALVLAALLAVGAWGQPPGRELSDQDYISIAISQPDVFHASAPPSEGIRARVVERTPSLVTVEVDYGTATYLVYVDPRTRQVTGVVRR